MIRRYWIVFALIVRVVAGENSVTAEAQRLSVSVTPGFDDDVWLGYTLKFELRVRNEGPKAILVPSEKSAFTVALEEAESKIATQKWRAIYRSSWYDTGASEYGKCISVGSRESTIITTLVSDVIIPRSEPRRARKLRLTLDLVCRSAQDKLSSVTVTTEPFDFIASSP